MSEHKRHLGSRVAQLEAELAHLESLPEVEVPYRDKLGRKRKRKTMPHTQRQFKRIAALRTTIIPKARQRAAGSS